jgi:hypothetical protein
MYGLPAPASSSMTDDVIRWQFVAGIYPMLLDETCFFLAVDFDVHPIGQVITSWHAHPINARIFARTSANSSAVTLPLRFAFRTRQSTLLI